MFNVELARDGPGLLLRDILKREDSDIELAAGIIAHVAPDVLVLTGFDYDQAGHALAAFSNRVAEQGHVFDHHFSRLPNAGLASGRDLDGDGRLGRPRDAFGFGEFAGQGGMAILSRFPILEDRAQDYVQFLWADLPGALTEGVSDLDVRRLSAVAHWNVPLDLEGVGVVDLMVWHASPPVFDGPEDRNGRRSHDETLFWYYMLEGALPFDAPQGPFILAGDANLDPVDGEGLSDAINALRAHPLLQDPAPRSEGGVRDAAADGGANLDQRGDPGLDTADWRDGPEDPGNLRVDYVLPSIHWQVVDSGVFWPAPDDPEVALLGEDGNGASRHRLVWVDLVLKGADERVGERGLGQVGAELP